MTTKPIDLKNHKLQQHANYCWCQKPPSFCNFSLNRHTVGGGDLSPTMTGYDHRLK